MKTTFQTTLEKWGRAVVLLLAGAVVWFLLEQSLFLTGTDSGSVNSFFTADSPWLHLLVFAALASAAALFAKKQAAIPPRLLLWGTRALLALYGLALLYFVLATRQYPRDDQRGMLELTQQLLQGDADSLLPGGYLAMHHHQKGLLLFFLPMAALFGEQAWLAIQLCNVIWAVLGVWLLAKTAALLFDDNEAVYRLALLAFLPEGLYVTFVYTNLIGMLAAVAGLYGLVRWQKTGGWRWAALACVGSALGGLLKGNYLIFTIAVGLYFVWAAVKNRSVRPLAALAGLLAVYVGLSAGINFYLYGSRGLTEPEGFPSGRWLTIGLTQTEGNLEGWYYNYLSDVDFTAPEQVSAAQTDARQKIETALSGFASDPAGALRFFSRKNSAQWNMATYHSLFINRNRADGTQAEMSDTAVSLLHDGGRLNRLYTAYCNLFVSQLWLGVLLFLVLGRRSLRLEQLLFAVILVGGFAFQTVWEGRAQYVLPYVFVAVPCAVRGFLLLGQRLAALWACPAGQRLPRLRRSGAVRWALALAVPLLLCGLTGYHFSVTAAEAQQDSEKYADYIQQAQPVLADGRYYVCQGADGLTVDLNNGAGGSRAYMSAEDKLPVQLYFAASSYVSDAHFYMMTTPEAVPQSIGGNAYHDKMYVGVKGEIDETATRQQWSLQQADGGWYLRNMTETGKQGELALAVEEGSSELVMTPFTGEESQLWQLIPMEG